MQLHTLHIITYNVITACMFLIHAVTGGTVLVPQGTVLVPHTCVTACMFLIHAVTHIAHYYI